MKYYFGPRAVGRAADNYSAYIQTVALPERGTHGYTRFGNAYSKSDPRRARHFETKFFSAGDDVINQRPEILLFRTTAEHLGLGPDMRLPSVMRPA